MSRGGTGGGRCSDDLRQKSDTKSDVRDDARPTKRTGVSRWAAGGWPVGHGMRGFATLVRERGGGGGGGMMPVRIALSSRRCTVCHWSTAEMRTDTPNRTRRRRCARDDGFARGLCTVEGIGEARRRFERTAAGIPHGGQ